MRMQDVHCVHGNSRVTLHHTATASVTSGGIALSRASCLTCTLGKGTHTAMQGELTEGLKALETGVRLLEQEHEATGSAADCLVTVRLETPEALRPRGKLAIPVALGGTGPAEAEPTADAGPLVRVALLVSQTAAEEGVFHEMLGGFVGRAQEVRGQLTERAAVTDQVRCCCAYVRWVVLCICALGGAIIVCACSTACAGAAWLGGVAGRASQQGASGVV